VTVHRNHLAKDDLDWLPERYRLLRGAVVGGVWSTIAGGIIAMFWAGGGHVFPVFGKAFVAIGAAGYWLGDRASKSLIAARMGKLASGQVDLARLSNQEDGDLVHVRGRVRAEQTIAGVLSDAAGVYRRTRVSFDDIQVIDEEAVDFQLIDGEGHAIAIEVEGARLVAHDPKMVAVPQSERICSLAKPVAAQRALTQAARGKGRPLAKIGFTGAEILLKPGDEIEVVGYKSRKVDPTVQDRLFRETPMRATLRAGKDLPLILSRVKRA
jgi:hypothetical protein